MSSERNLEGCYLQGISITKSIAIGTISHWQGHRAPLKKKHKWSVYVRGLFQEDLSYLIDKVVFHLHEDFKKPVRTIREFPFEVREMGWGEFDIPMYIYFHEYTSNPLQLSVQLKLFPGPNKPLTRAPVQNELFVEATFKHPPVRFYRRAMIGPHQVLPIQPSALKLATAQDYAISEQKSLKKIVDKHVEVLEEIKLFKERYWKLDALITEKKKINYANSFRPLQSGPIEIDSPKKLNETVSLTIPSDLNVKKVEQHKKPQPLSMPQDNVVVSQTPQPSYNPQIPKGGKIRHQVRPRANMPVAHNTTANYHPQQTMTSSQQQIMAATQRYLSAQSQGLNHAQMAQITAHQQQYLHQHRILQQRQQQYYQMQRQGMITNNQAAQIQMNHLTQMQKRRRHNPY